MDTIRDHYDAEQVPSTWHDLARVPTWRVRFPRVTPHGRFPRGADPEEQGRAARAGAAREAFAPGEIGRDAPEMHPRCARDAPEMRPRCTRGMRVQDAAKDALAKTLRVVISNEARTYSTHQNLTIGGFRT